MPASVTIKTNYLGNRVSGATCAQHVSSVWKLTADVIAIITFGSQESHLESTHTSQEATRRITTNNPL